MSPQRFVVHGSSRVELAYSDVGAGRAVLNAHGLTASRAVVANSGLGDFSAVSQRARLVSYDARGHGESSGGTEPADYAWPNLAYDLLALAAHVSPDERVSGIGVSMGTATLLHAAVKQPARFERLVLTAPPTAWDTRVAQKQLYAELAMLAETTAPESLRKVFRKGLIAPIFQELPNYPPLPDVPHALLPSVFRGAGVSDLPSPEQLRALPHDTLILAWATDPAHPLSTAEKLAALLPHSQLQVAHTVDDIRGWGALAAQFLAA
jgi:pimeloyl-ACP methyl ester carboxylesterase